MVHSGWLLRLNIETALLTSAATSLRRDIHCPRGFSEAVSLLVFALQFIENKKSSAINAELSEGLGDSIPWLCAQPYKHPRGRRAILIVCSIRQLLRDPLIV